MSTTFVVPALGLDAPEDACSMLENRFECFPPGRSKEAQEARAKVTACPRCSWDKTKFLIWYGQKHKVPLENAINAWPWHIRKCGLPGSEEDGDDSAKAQCEPDQSGRRVQEQEDDNEAKKPSDRAASDQVKGKGREDQGEPYSKAKRDQDAQEGDEKEAKTGSPSVLWRRVTEEDMIHARRELCNDQRDWTPEQIKKRVLAVVRHDDKDNCAVRDVLRLITGDQAKLTDNTLAHWRKKCPRDFHSCVEVHFANTGKTAPCLPFVQLCDLMSSDATKYIPKRFMASDSEARRVLSLLSSALPRKDKDHHRENPEDQENQETHKNDDENERHDSEEDHSDKEDSDAGGVDEEIKEAESEKQDKKAQEKGPQQTPWYCSWSAMRHGDRRRRDQDAQRPLVLFAPKSRLAFAAHQGTCLFRRSSR